MHDFEQFRRVRHVVAAAAMVALSACGGGGGSSSDTGQDVGPSSLTNTVSGVAAMGLLKNALVTAYLPDAKGQPGQKLDETRTDPSGAYRFSNLPAGQVILLVVSRNPDATAPTVMTDEATNLDVPVTADFQLSAATVIPAMAGAHNIVQVTPYSTMAVEKARAAVQSSGQFDEQTVGLANADIRRYTGFDVLGDAPLFDATGHTPLNAAALALAAVSTLAQNQSAESCPALQGLSDAQAIASVKATCQLAVLKQAGSSNAALVDQLAAAQQTTLVNEGYSGALPPAPAVQPATLPNVPVADVAAAKALVSYLRSDVPFILGETGDTLRTRLTQVQADINASINPVDSINMRLLDAINYASWLYADREYGVPASSVRFDVGGRQIGCAFYTDNSYSVVAVNPAERRTQVCRVTYGYQLKTPATGSSPAVYTALQHAIFMEPGAETDSPTGGTSEFTFRTSLLWQDGTVDAGGAFVPNWQTGQHTMLAAGGASDPASSKLVATVSGSWAVKAGVGDYATGLSLKGELAPAYERVNGVVQAKGQKTKVDLVFVPDLQANQLSKLNVTGGFTGVDGNGGESAIKLLEGSSIQGWLNLPDFSSDTLLAKLDDLSLTLVLRATTPTGSVVNGTVALSRFTDTQAASGGALTPSQRVDEQISQPALTSFVGTVTRNGQVLISGKVQLNRDGLATSTVTSTLKVNATVQVPSRPDLVLKDLVLTETASKLDIAGRLEQGSLWISVSGQVDANDVLKLSLLSDAGVSLAIDSASATGRFPLMKSSNVVGELDSKAGQVTFVDNSYERF